MLRIRLRMCQGVVPNGVIRDSRRGELQSVRSCSNDVAVPHWDMIFNSPSKQGIDFCFDPFAEGSPINVSTTVPLTQIGPNPILHEIEHYATHGDRRKLIETMGREPVYRLGTGSEPNLLDIGVPRYRLAPGL